MDRQQRDNIMTIWQLNTRITLSCVALLGASLFAVVVLAFQHHHSFPRRRISFSGVGGSLLPAGGRGLACRGLDRLCPGVAQNHHPLDCRTVGPFDGRIRSFYVASLKNPPRWWRRMLTSHLCDSSDVSGHLSA